MILPPPFGKLGDLTLAMSSGAMNGESFNTDKDTLSSISQMRSLKSATLWESVASCSTNLMTPEYPEKITDCQDKRAWVCKYL